MMRIIFSTLMALTLTLASAFQFSPSPASFKSTRLAQSKSMQFAISKRSETQNSDLLEPIVNFADGNEDSISKFERVDDAVMGGISTSALKQFPNEPFGRWSGVCRVDGGGFCGVRTLPFKEPLDAGDADGIYLLCRFTSDEEPERRVWKVTTRSEQSRGEMLYQSTYNPKANAEEWTQITIPFSDFKLVRGPRLVVGAAPLNVESGLYQIGLSMSKFNIAENMTELEDFRPGYFELQLKEIGLYKCQGTGKLSPKSLETITKEESLQQRPLLLKILRPISKIFFTEQSQRRKSALRLLQKRGLSRSRAILFGFRRKANSSGILKALGHSILILSKDVARTCFGWIIRFCLFYPIIYMSRILKVLKRLFESEKQPTPGN